jgi:hypothetical protein
MARVELLDIENEDSDAEIDQLDESQYGPGSTRTTPHRPRRSITPNLPTLTQQRSRITRTTHAPRSKAKKASRAQGARGATSTRATDTAPLRGDSAEPACQEFVNVAHDNPQDAVFPYDSEASEGLDVLCGTVFDLFQSAASQYGVEFEQVVAHFYRTEKRYSNNKRLTRGTSEVSALPLPSFTSDGLSYSSYVKTITCENSKDREARVNYLKKQLTAQIGLFCLDFAPRIHCHQLSEMLGVKWRSDRLFPWKTMIMELAKAGVMLINFPENCRHPSQMPKDSSRGISELHSSEQTLLMNALVHPKHPLYFVKLVDAKKSKGMFGVSNVCIVGDIHIS